MPEIYRFAGWQLDVGARTLTKEGMSAALTQRTLDVLIYLVRNAGRVVPKEELLDAVWLDAAVEPGTSPSRSLPSAKRSASGRASTGI